MEFFNSVGENNGMSNKYTKYCVNIAQMLGVMILDSSGKGKFG
jgi:hypothetical protein